MPFTKKTKKPKEESSESESSESSESYYEDSDDEDFPENIQLGKVDKCVKLGSFRVNNKGVAIGETNYDIIKIKPGIYNAYKVDDNLMIINSKIKMPTKPQLKKLEWTYTHEGFDVTTGIFGFYDLATIQKIKKLLGEDNKDCTLPLLDCNSNEMVDGSCIEELDEKDQKKISHFGVVIDSSMSDIGVECYAIDDTLAILIGGNTAERLFEGSDID